MLKRNIPQGFIDRRNQLGYSVEEVASSIGVSARTVRYWESGERLPNLTPMQTKLLFRKLRLTANLFASYFESEVVAA